METMIQNENEVLSSASAEEVLGESLPDAAPEAADDGGGASIESASADGTEATPIEDAASAVNWQERYEKSEARLKSSLAFATLFAPYIKEGEDLAASPVYARYLELVDKGLSAEEAFAAAARTGLRGESGASKAHLTSGVPGAQVTVSRMSGEEMAIARELLGGTHSDRELERLFRRVSKT